MMVNSAQSVEDGGCTPSPFHSLYHHEQSCGVRSSWEGRYTSPIATLPFFPLWYRVSLYTMSHINRFTVTSTESTHSGNGHYLAYILSCWKNQPSLVRVVDARPPLFTISTLQLRGQIHSSYFYSTPTCTMWSPPTHTPHCPAENAIKKILVSFWDGLHSQRPLTSSMYNINLIFFPMTS